MDEHPNVALIRRALEYVANRDDDGLLSVWHDDMRYYAIEGSGPTAEWDRDEFVTMMTTGRRMVPEHTYEPLDLRAVGSDLVVAHCRIRATSSRTGEPVCGDYLCVLRVRDGLLSEGWEFVSDEIRQFLAQSWG